MAKRRTKRLFPLKYSAGYIHTPTPMNPIILEEYVSRTRPIDYSYAALLGLTKGTYTRTQALKRAEIIGAAQLASDNELRHNVTLRRSSQYSLVVFYNKKQDAWIFFETDNIVGRIRRSVIYGSRERAFTVFNNKRILWLNSQTVWLSDETPSTTSP